MSNQLSNQLTTISTKAVFVVEAFMDRFNEARRALVEDDRGLTSTEWALLVAGAAAIAMSIVVVIRQVTQDTGNGLQDNVDNLNTNATF